CWFWSSGSPCGSWLKRSNSTSTIHLDGHPGLHRWRCGNYTTCSDTNPFSDEWIKTRLLAPGALDGLNDQARAIFKIMMNTGLRLIEIASLTPEEICLDDPKEGGLSYVQGLPIGRELKSRRAKRRVPLLGVSLDAMLGFPEGFSNYRQNSATLSATLNKYLRENDLKETEDHV
ncbi:hypothetical protein AB9K37_00465, partial [Donghicola sp. XS_ASV15]